MNDNHLNHPPSSNETLTPKSVVGARECGRNTSGCEAKDVVLTTGRRGQRPRKCSTSAKDGKTCVARPVRKQANRVKPPRWRPAQLQDIYIWLPRPDGSEECFERLAPQLVDHRATRDRVRRKDARVVRKPKGRASPQRRAKREFDSTLGYPGEGPPVECDRVRTCRRPAHLHKRLLSGAGRRIAESKGGGQPAPGPKKPPTFVTCHLPECPQPTHYHPGVGETYQSYAAAEIKERAAEGRGDPTEHLGRAVLGLDAQTAADQVEDGQDFPVAPQNILDIPGICPEDGVDLDLDLLELNERLRDLKMPDAPRTELPLDSDLDQGSDDDPYGPREVQRWVPAPGPVRPASSPPPADRPSTPPSAPDPPRPRRPRRIRHPLVPPEITTDPPVRLPFPLLDFKYGDGGDGVAPRGPDDLQGILDHVVFMPAEPAPIIDPFPEPLDADPVVPPLPPAPAPAPPPAAAPLLPALPPPPPPPAVEPAPHAPPAVVPEPPLPPNPLLPPPVPFIPPAPVGGDPLVAVLAAIDHVAALPGAPAPLLAALDDLAAGVAGGAGDASDDDPDQDEFDELWVEDPPAVIVHALPPHHPFPPEGEDPDDDSDNEDPDEWMPAPPPPPELQVPDEIKYLTNEYARAMPPIIQPADERLHTIVRPIYNFGSSGLRRRWFQGWGYKLASLFFDKRSTVRTVEGVDLTLQNQGIGSSAIRVAGVVFNQNPRLVRGDFNTSAPLVDAGFSSVRTAYVYSHLYEYLVAAKDGYMNPIARDGTPNPSVMQRVLTLATRVDLDLVQLAADVCPWAAADSTIFHDTVAAATSERYRCAYRIHLTLTPATEVPPF